MILSLKLTNFKRHESLELNFTGGLNLIRANSEAGKSSALQAISYALYGARALPMSLAETVTYDKPESSLRVLLRFSFNGSEFEVERHKGGAELRGDGVTASGQSEVTSVIERLFGCSANVATSLMFAQQNALRGSLEGGPGAAVSLIEKLADVDALDRLVEKAQSDLLSGNTKLIEARIAELTALEKPVADFSELQTLLAAAEARATVTSQRAKTWQDALATTDAPKLNRVVAEADAAIQALAKAQTTQKSLEVTASQPLPKLQDLNLLRTKVQQQAEAATLRLQYTAFLSIDQYEPVAATQDEVTTQGQALRLRLSAILAEAKVLTRGLAVAETSIIKGNLCDFCGKSFDDVPEVIAKNKQCQEAAEIARLQMAALDAEALKIEADLSDVSLTIQAANTLITKMSTLPVEALGGYPSKYKWVGGNIPEKDDTDYAAELKAAEAANGAAQRTIAQIERAQTSLAELDLPSLTEAAVQATINGQEALVLLEQIAKWQAGLQESLAAEKLATAEAAQARSALAVSQAQSAAALQTWEVAQRDLAKTKADLSAYVLNNRVIKKIRDARPLVAKQLWSIVLGTVSHYFSQVRGTPSVVTREGSGFMVDGKPVAGLSGSTLDSLGLAIRIALTRTFLSNVPWLILDEPAAGCDIDREGAMLGVISACGFPQVVMVSHRELGETYASNVISF